MIDPILAARQGFEPKKAATSIPLAALGPAGAIPDLRSAAEIEAAQKIMDLFARSDLTDDQKRRILRGEFARGKRERAAHVRTIRKLNEEIKTLDNREAEARAVLDAQQRIAQWANEPLILQRLPGSRLDRVRVSCRHHPLRKIEIPEAAAELGFLHLWDDAGPQSVVIQHDWRAAFANATDFDGGEFNLPFPATCFEMGISGKHVAVCAMQDSESPVTFMVLVEDGTWFHPIAIGRSWESGHWRAINSDTERHAALASFIGSQVSAACISLDAEVAEVTPHRADHLSNQAKEALPRAFFDYHVISLARRHRSVPRLGEATAIRKRLHFRRGHWRHYARFKTWVRWALVGDPSLGFIDSEYRL